MKKACYVCFAGVLLVGLMSGCNITIAEAGSEKESQSISSGGMQQPTVSNAQLLPEQSITSQESASIQAVETESLSFLTEEQQAVYQEAYNAQNWLYGLADNLLSNGGVNLVGGQAYEWQVDQNGNVMNTPEGNILYVNSYEGFRNYVYSVFSKSFVANLGFFEKKFTNFDGKLATNSALFCNCAQGWWRGVADNYQDAFRPGSSSDDKVTFFLIGHYDRNQISGKYEGDTLDVYTVEYPITLVKENGSWLVEEFHTTQFG